jgi:hypothetical protein
VWTRPAAAGAAYRQVQFAAPDEVRPFAPLGGPLKVTLTGSAHNKDGWLRKNDPETLDVLRHLEAKVATRASDMAANRHGVNILWMRTTKKHDTTRPTQGANLGPLRRSAGDRRPQGCAEAGCTIQRPRSTTVSRSRFASAAFDPRHFDGRRTGIEG